MGADIKTEEYEVVVKKKRITSLTYTVDGENLRLFFDELKAIEENFGLYNKVTGNHLLSLFDQLRPYFEGA